MRPLRATLLALVALAVAPAGALAKDAKPSIYTSKLLWATVNVCDTAAKPDTVGIRASMPGSGIRGEQMFIRFQLQFFDVTDKRWHNVGPAGDSGFLAVGSALYRSRQTGTNFKVMPPASGAFILRGAVTFEWRKDGDVVRRARKRTRSKHPNTIGADPKGFSAATCEVRP